MGFKLLRFKAGKKAVFEGTIRKETTKKPYTQSRLGIPQSIAKGFVGKKVIVTIEVKEES